MATIFYSTCGEGRGHATRVRALVERLRGEHEIVLFAFGDAFSLLATAYRGSEVRVEEIPGLRFGYGRRQQLSLARTAITVARYLASLGSLSGRLATCVASERPDLVVSDFEPALPSVARRLGVPVISIDHQHFLTTEELGKLPVGLRIHARLMAVIVSAYLHGQRETVVSSFHHLPLRKGVRNVTRVGTLLRPEVRAARVSDRGHLVAYFRRALPARVLDALASCGIETHVYGLPRRSSTGTMSFFEVSEAGFVADLASCRALVTTAGNQIVGEAMFLGKPVLALPEPGNFEQAINGHLLAESQCGVSVSPLSIEAEHVKAFLDRLEWFEANIRAQRVDGTEAALAALGRHLPRGLEERVGVARAPRRLPRMVAPAAVAGGV